MVSFLEIIWRPILCFLYFLSQTNETAEVTLIHKHSLQERGDTWEGSMLLIKSGIKRSSHYNGGIWKRSFISMVITLFKPEEFENSSFVF